MGRHSGLHSSISLSIILHLVLCAALFLMIVHKQLPFPTRMLSAPQPVPAPVMFVQEPQPKPQPAPETTPLVVDPPGVPNGLKIDTGQLPHESALAGKSVGLPQTSEVSTQAKKLPLPLPTPQDPPIKQDTFHNQADRPATQQPSKTGLPAAAQTLSLADLFKNTHHLVAQENSDLTSTDGGGGPSGQIVISEGSLKYYSLWTKFLSHLNDAARFNRRGGKNTEVQAWLRNGLIKKEALFAIDVDKKGQVVNVILMSSSGHTPFDQLCISDIWSAVPYPPLPASITRPTARFQVKAFF